VLVAHPFELNVELPVVVLVAGSYQSMHVAVAETEVEVEQQAADIVVEDVASKVGSHQSTVVPSVVETYYQLVVVVELGMDAGR
jgi:hypothetical protein